MSRGACLWLTGFSGSGKTATTELLVPMLLERGRSVTVLDGDVVRTHLSRELGFSKEDRDENVRRVGFVATEVVRHGGVAVCALVSPYRATRDEVRQMVNDVGGDGSFVEIFVDTPIEVVKERDVKGLYAATSRGEVQRMTGVADPYEPPLDPEVHIQTVGLTVEQSAQAVIDYLETHGFLD